MEGLSDFLKLAYKHNKVKELDEAFEKFPVEEECHKGKIENVLREEEEIYEFYEIGDIVFVRRYKYADGTDEIYKILNEQIVFKIGKVDQDKIEEYKDSFKKTLKDD